MGEPFRPQHREVTGRRTQLFKHCCLPAHPEQPPSTNLSRVQLPGERRLRISSGPACCQGRGRGCAGTCWLHTNPRSDPRAHRQKRCLAVPRNTTADPSWVLVEMPAEGLVPRCCPARRPGQPWVFSGQRSRRVLALQDGQRAAPERPLRSSTPKPGTARSGLPAYAAAGSFTTWFK